MKPISALLAFAACLWLHTTPCLAQDYYFVETLAQDATDVELRAEARELEEMYAALSAQAGIDARLIYSDNEEINAYATEVKGERVIVIQEGLLRLLRDDRDAVAAVLGHELAHHRADHVREGHRKQQQTRAFGSVLGVLVGVAVGQEHGELAGSVSQAAVGVGAELAALRFNRKQELEADQLSVQWMLAAGYDPAGMLRLQQRLGEISGRRNGGIFATHPSSKKRFQAVERQLAALPAAEGAATPQPLVDQQDLLAAAESIAQDMPPQGIDQPTSASANAVHQGQGVHIGDNVKMGDNVKVGRQKEADAPKRD